MKAIEILFEDLNRMNIEIKNANDIPSKLKNLDEMQNLIEMISNLARHQLQFHKEEYL